MVKSRSVHLVRILGSFMLSDITALQVIEYMEKRHGEEASGRTI